MSLSKEAEQKLYDSLVDTIALVKDGESPNAAIIKVATEQKLPPGHIRLLASAYNTGCTNKQRTGSSSVFDKVAAFAIADPAEIISAIYPTTVKTAAAIARETSVSEEYDSAPDWMTRRKLAVDLSVDANRQHVAKKDFAMPGSAPKGETHEAAKGKYPIPDKVHARAALGFAAMHHGKDSAEYKAVASKVHAKFGSADDLFDLYNDPILPDLPRDPTRFFKRADGALHRLRLERERLTDAVTASWTKVSSAFGELQMYFRQSHAHPLEEVQQNAEALYGPAAAVVFDKMAHGDCCMAAKPMAIKKPKKAKPMEAKPMAIKRSYITHAIDAAEPPYSSIRDVIDGSIEYHANFNKAAAFEKEAVDLELRLHRAMAPIAPAPLPADPSLPILNRVAGEKRAYAKEATPFGVLATGAELGLGADMSRGILSKLGPKPDAKLKQEALEDLSDPSHDARLRSIRAQAALHSILNGPYFEGEDPVKATQMFNNLTHLSPRMADQPILLEAAMRRLASQGSVDPHDVEQLLSIETKMKQRDRAPKDEPAEVSAE